MTREDINRVFTEKVIDLIAQGYQIHTDFMSGSQGEIAKVDLSNGTEILRVFLDSRLGIDLDGYSGLRIVVGRNTDKGGVIWNDHLEILSETKFFLVSANSYMTPEEANAI